MADNRWTATKAFELAKDWDLAPQTVRHYAAEASRRIRAVVYMAGLDARMMAGLQAIIEDCLHGRKRERRTAVEAYRVMAGIASAREERRAAKKPGGPAKQDELKFIIELSEPMKPGVPAPIAPATTDAHVAIPAEPQAP
jgi:hypothetical protein